MARPAVPSYNPAVSSAPKRLDHDLDKFHEECALFGIFGTSDAAAHTALGLHALQHRGQEASGIVTFDGRHFHNHRAAGLVGDIFGEQSVIAKLKGYAAIGHNRYATTGGSVATATSSRSSPISTSAASRSPITATSPTPTCCARSWCGCGCLFQSTTDTEVIIHLIARSQLLDRRRPRDRRAAPGRGRLLAGGADQRGADRRARSAWACARWCSASSDDAWILASETCALDIIGARLRARRRAGRDRHHRRQRPALDQALHASSSAASASSSTSTSPGPTAWSRASASTRRASASARELARESPVPADVVVPVPDSGVPAAIGYAAAVGHPVRARHHPQPLCRPHLHRAGRPHPPSRRAAEAQRQPRP